MGFPCDYYFKGRKLTYNQFKAELKNLPMSEIEEMFPSIKDEGIKSIAWTTGEQQNDRYSLEKQVDEISYLETKEKGIYDVKATKNNKEVFADNKMDLKKIEATLGKDMAEKISNGVGEVKRGITFISGNDLKVGGKGMKGFYGSPKDGSLGIVGNVAKNLFKQEPKVITIKTGANLEADGEVGFYELSDGYYAVEYKGEQKEFDNISDAQKYYDSVAKSIATQHSVDITPNIVSQAKEGLPLFSRQDKFQEWVEGKVNKLFDKIPDMYGNKEYVEQSIEGIYEWLKEKGKDLSKADKSLISARMKEKFGIVDPKVKAAKKTADATFNNQKAERIADELNIPLEKTFLRGKYKDHIERAIEADLNPALILNRVNQGNTSLTPNEYFTLVILHSDTYQSVLSLEQRSKLGLATNEDIKQLEIFRNQMDEINTALVRSRSDSALMLGSGSHLLPLPKARTAEEIADLYNKAAGTSATDQSRKATQKLAEDLAKLEAEHRADLEDAKAANDLLEAKVTELAAKIASGEVKAKKVNPSRINNKKDLIEYAKTMSKSGILKSKTEGDTEADADPIKVRREFILGAIKVAIEGGADHTSMTAITGAVNDLIKEVNQETGENTIKPTDTKEIIANLLPLTRSNINEAKARVNKAVNELRTEAKRLNNLHNLLKGIYNPQTRPIPNATQIKEIIDKIRAAANKSETSEGAKTEINALLEKVDKNIINWAETGSKDAISAAIDAVRTLSTRRSGKPQMTIEEKESAIAKDTERWLGYKKKIDDVAKTPKSSVEDLIDVMKDMPLLPKKRENQYLRRVQVREIKLRKLRANLRVVAETAHKKANSSWVEKRVTDLDDIVFNFFKAAKVTWDMSAPFTVGYLGGMKLYFDAIVEGDRAKAAVIWDALSKAGKAFKGGLSNKEDFATQHYEKLQEAGGDIYEHLFGLKLSHPFDPELSEEYFRSNFAAKAGQWLGKLKIPLNLFQASEAHMTTYLNTIRFALFDSFYKANPNASIEEFKNYAETINMLTGTTKATVGGVMTRLFLAPKYMISRWKVMGATLNPEILWKGKQSKESAAIRSAVLMALAWPMALAMLASLLSGDDEPLLSIDFDSLSPHFLKTKIGDNYIETIPALTNIVRIFTQGSLVSMNALDVGNLTDIEKSQGFLSGNKGKDVTYPAQKYILSRLNPSVGVAKSLLTWSDYKGDPYQPGGDGFLNVLQDVLAPLFLSSLVDNVVNPTDEIGFERIFQPAVELFGMPVVNYQNAAMHKDVQEIFKKADWAVSSKARTPESSWTYPHEYFRDAYKDELKHRLGLAILALKKDDPEKTFTYKQLDKLLGDVKGNRVGYALSEERNMPIDKYLREKYTRRYGEEDLNKYIGNAKKEMEKEEAEKKEKRGK